ncbi:hypothetical protein IC762_04140 [Bradyrhizobium genosp. L]|uniref:Hint domain-containing protein n=1 Tax=Bradyrhizobium genosp. L TaxID=83637 RepID=UPI0018A2A105|nr:Hint domain-containing protein [Bradyrhizobium genosp. L]QPF85527.1 hypothetical protein IC762_04140 [Bradyrhizobium genosp. L]
MKTIPQISKGDRVWTKPSAAASLELCTVKRVQRFDAGEIVSIRFASGRALRVTKSHSLLSEDHGWTTVRKLRFGQALLRNDHLDSYFDEILEITECEREPVYNLVVDKNFTFLVQGGYVAHSFTVARAPRVFIETTISRLESRLGLVALFASLQQRLSFVAK